MIGQKVGCTMLGQWSQETVKETIEMYKDGYFMPPGIYAEGLPFPSHAHPLDRERIKLPVRPPALARTSAVAGHIGHIVEDHLVTEMRAFHDLNKHKKFR
eukprot:7110439-Pyramimonas_sp.AAC.1